MRRFIVVVLDSFGVGAMDDVPKVRPADIGSNTCKSVLSNNPNLYLPQLEGLGIMNAVGEDIGQMKKVENPHYGISDLAHIGGDTFFGHQEIMGTLPKKPWREPFQHVIDTVEKHLLESCYEVERLGNIGEQVLLVNKTMTVGDNLETDPGQVYNVTGTLQEVAFEDIVRLGKTVRQVVKVARVIAFGGQAATVDSIKSAYRTKPGGYAGIDAPLSGVYKENYQVIHLGYGIDPETQVPTILGKEGIPVILLGKVADIVENRFGQSIPGVDSETLFKQTVEKMKEMEYGFICLNIQETDLAGHAQDANLYGNRLLDSDEGLAKIRAELIEGDVLIVMADHGNDPTIGHSQHTRERVPLLIDAPGAKKMYIGHRSTMADVGATVCDYFGVNRPESGTSFLKDVQVEQFV
ncbi:phosphopentomutase [Bacillus sp. sid0103]|uniref:phosphopentomutase n=1 Tax=Bacillus sp. sid0103 TaxID=2856337 RepID=UPI001C46DC36|nr:phosphopentomutase [Bacillus sp. sid0103]MBV7509457.1 phosphopentomutase [Bacillus sp. sid0103]